MKIGYAGSRRQGRGDLVHARELSGEIVDARLRTCATCAAVHPPADLGDIAWAEVAAALRAEGQPS